MKIYHTETQADYDALMIELEKQGCEWLSGRRPTETTKNWKQNSSETCVRVGKKMAMYDKKSYYTWEYPDTPIIKYKVKADEKMKFTKENVLNLTDGWIESKIISFQDLQNEIKELDDTPEKVVVPKFVAEWIQSYLNEGGTPIDVLGSLMSFHASFVDESVIRWFKKNSETMLKALTNGYTIEPEQLYYIPLPHLETTDGIQQVLSKSRNDTNYFASRPASALQQRFTKEELEQVPEVYKPYAKLIEEEEE